MNKQEIIKVVAEALRAQYPTKEFQVGKSSVNVHEPGSPRQGYVIEVKTSYTAFKETAAKIRARAGRAIHG